MSIRIKAVILKILRLLHSLRLSGGRWEKENKELYSLIKGVLEKARRIRKPRRNCKAKDDRI